VDGSCGRCVVENGYVLCLNKSARWAKGLKVEGRSCSRPGGASPDASAT
jgi:hypothetical protein